MKLNRTIIPNDSILHTWMDQWSNTEVFLSWQILTGLAAIGVMLQRNVCFDLGQAAQLWPNTSVLLVGPSGSGKDTIINPTCQLIEGCGGHQVMGRTLEAVKESLTQMGDPAVGFINASELADFLGCKDYQAGIVQALTDILSSNKNKIDVSLKGDITKGFSRAIHNPSLTMFAGSTAEWLQTMMPDGTMDGGFLPRFVIAAEWSKKDEGIRPISHPGRYDSQNHKERVLGGQAKFWEFLTDLAQRTLLPVGTSARRMSETTGLDNAEAWYENWYNNRLKKFTPLLQAYASRSGGLMQRLGMLMAVSRGHINFIEEVDYYFADAVIQHAAERLERAVIPQSPEVKVSWEILTLLPAPNAQILRHLAPKWGTMWVKRGLTYLLETEQVTHKEGKFIASTSSTDVKS